MKRYALALTLLLSLDARAQVVSDMTPDRIREAIQAGTKSDDYGDYQIRSKALISTPWSRVAMAASKAKESYREVRPESFDSADLAPELHIAIPAYADKRNRIVSPKAVVVKTDAGIVQPLRAETHEEAFANSFGATFRGQSLVAYFPLAVVSPRNEVRIVYDDGDEVRWKFKAKIR